MNAARRRMEAFSFDDVPRIEAGDALVPLLIDRLATLPIRSGDVVAVTSKLFSRAEGRFVYLPDVEITEEARTLAEKVHKDPALVTLILSESTYVSRACLGVLIVRHRLGYISANAGIDHSNAMPKDAAPDTRGQWALLLPRDPDRSAHALRASIQSHCGVDVGVVITDSHGRPFRKGSLGIAIGASGLTVLDPHEGRVDLDGRPLEVTSTAVADQIAATADLLAGQADEGVPMIVLRGLDVSGDDNAQRLIREPEHDLYA